MDWVAIVAAVAAVLAAVFAGWQAWEARASRKAAARSEVGAGEQADRSFAQAERAVGEAGRAADAQQAIAAGVQRMTRPRDPWWVGEDRYGTYLLRNDGDRRVITTRAEIVDEQGDPAGRVVDDDWDMGEKVVWQQGTQRRLRPAETGGMADPGYVTLRIWWREVDADPESEDRLFTHRFQ